MSIKGLTDRGCALPEIGQIRKGAPKQANRPGPDLEYFRVDFDEKEVESATLFFELYGDKPAAIEIWFPFPEIERNWDPYLEAYTAGRMVARSDGEIYLYLVNPLTGEVVVKNGVDKNGNQVPYVDGQPAGYYLDRKSNKKVPVFCKPVGRLKIVPAGLGRACVMTVMTTSWHDIRNISEQLRAIYELNGGRINRVKFVLRRVPRMISTPGEGGQAVRRKKWLISVEAIPEWYQLQQNLITATTQAYLESLQPVPVDHDTPPEPDQEDLLEGKFEEMVPQTPEDELIPEDEEFLIDLGEGDIDEVPAEMLPDPFAAFEAKMLPEEVHEESIVEALQRIQDEFKDGHEPCCDCMLCRPEPVLPPGEELEKLAPEEPDVSDVKDVKDVKPKTQTFSKERPYAPETVKKGIFDKIPLYASQVDLVTDKFRQQVAAKLNACFQGSDTFEHTPDECRHFVLQWLTGKGSIKEVRPEVLLVIDRWMSCEYIENRWIPRFDAIEEARRIYWRATQDLDYQPEIAGLA